MSQKFQASIQQRGEYSYVKLGGVIDEDNELGELVDRIPAGTALIDVGDIERINSCGVRDWVNWLGKLDVQGARSVLVECSPAIVAQINLVNNFTGNGVVKSFYVPYFCPECDEEKVLLVETAEMGPPPHEPPTCRCDECDLVMDFDDMPDSYFAFLSNAKKVADAESIDGALSQMTAGSAVPKQARGTVSSKVKARSSSPNLSAAGSKPSVPSLPPVGKGGAAKATSSAGSRPNVSAAQLDQYQAQVKAAGKTPMTAQGSSHGAFGAPLPTLSGPQGHIPGQAGMAPAMSNPGAQKWVYVLISALVVAIAVLALLVLKK
jgi:anti-anti-sigma regulatory factor